MGKVLYVNFKGKQKLSIPNYKMIKMLRDVTVTLHYRALKGSEDKVEDNYNYIKNLNGIMESCLRSNPELIKMIKSQDKKENKILKYKVRTTQEARMYLVQVVGFFNNLDISYNKVKCPKQKFYDKVKLIGWILIFLTIYVYTNFNKGSMNGIWVKLDLTILIGGIIYISYKNSCYESKILSEKKLKKDIEKLKKEFCV